MQRSSIGRNMKGRMPQRKQRNPKERGAKARQPAPRNTFTQEFKSVTYYSNSPTNCQVLNTLTDADIGGQYEPHQYAAANKDKGTRAKPTVVTPFAPKERTAPKSPPTRFTGRELQHMEFPEIRYIVPGFIPEGKSILAGKPKIGKSWLSLDIACAVAMGGYAMGSIKCEQGDALYAALEDNPRRLQGRLNLVLQGQEWPERLTIWTTSPRLGNGLIEELECWLNNSDNPRLIILDTLGKIRSKPESGDKSSAYDNDYREMETLHALAAKWQIAIVVVHHTRKSEADDPIDTVSGTLGLAGAADTILVLDRKANGATLYGRGRDIEEIEKAVKFNTCMFRWEVLGDAAEVGTSNARKEVLAAIGNDDMSIVNIMAAVGGERPKVEMLLSRMVKDGLLERAGRGKYRLSAIQSNETYRRQSNT